MLFCFYAFSVNYTPHPFVYSRDFAKVADLVATVRELLLQNKATKKLAKTWFLEAPLCYSNYWKNRIS